MNGYRDEPDSLWIERKVGIGQIVENDLLLKQK